MDPDIALLVREERLLEAARLAADRGHAHDASVLYERACAWREAAIEAMRAGEAARALELAVEAADGAVAERACAIVAAEERAAGAIADKLARRGRHAWAARVLQECGRTEGAAEQWERAGEAVRAAELRERAGDAAGAARVLESALRRDASRWPVAVALGALLDRFGKSEAAVRVLQRVPPDAPERRDALAILAPALERSGLARVASAAADELAALGGSLARQPTPPPAAQQRCPRARLFGRYDVVREVASSPGARVLECIDAVAGERVAVKLLAACNVAPSGRDAMSRFEREARAMRALDHPNVVPLRDFVADGPAIVLAWMPGGTLESMCAAARLAPARAVEITCAVLSALGGAHRLGILHRDVKPANVLFDAAGAARLGDFGVAHLGDVSTTATAGVFGTIGYMSPEQREGRPATPASDVYAAGAMLREMLTGERPSAGREPGVLPSLAHGGTDGRHDAVVLRMTARDPAARFSDALEALAALAALDWPANVDAAVSSASQKPPSMGSTSARAGDAERVETTGDGAAFDTWAGRAIERVSLSDRAWARARSFAAVDHPAMQTILRVDRPGGVLWIDSPRGRPLDRALAEDERAALTLALDALHATGTVHGAIDRSHVIVRDDGPLLRFEPETDATTAADRDRIDLARL